MVKQKPTGKHRLLVRLAITATLLLLAVWVLARHWQIVSNSLHIAQTAHGGWLIGSVGLMIATFCIAAAIYGVLALHHLRYGQTVLIEYAAAFVNRLLPSGLGGLGLHGVYLYRRKHTIAESTAVVSVNNLIGITAHLVLLVLVGILRPTVLHQFILGTHLPDKRQAAVMILLGGITVVALWSLRHRIARFGGNLLRSLQALRIQKVFIALLLAMVLTSTYTFILYSVTRSLDMSITPLQAFIIFSTGMLTSTATPTPGGLVGAEAGLFAGFLIYGVSDASAGAAVLLYRLITYWIPLLPGVAALLVARRKRLL
ncbi:MAG TPA: YbhN family protein [Candidatus Saccharimonadia bacterium]|nr:YbhN family protein [Candidatus Saccharimonadia bacterium]